MRSHAIVVTLLLLTNWSTAGAEDWPAFRGPNGDGQAAAGEYPTQWDRERNILWRFELPAAGNSSPIVSHGRVFVTCATEEGRHRELFCLDADSGELLWSRDVAFDRVTPTHQTNPYCGSTPAADGRRVVVWHASAGLYCYDFDGKELWSRQLGDFEHTWGYGGSPVIHNGRVILHCGPGKRVFMTAINLENGETLWETEEPIDGDGDRNSDGKYMGSWSTPVIAKIDGREVAVCSMATRVNAYDPATGRIVWSCGGLRGKKGDLAYTSPVLAGDVCVVMGGFNGPAFGFKPGGEGDITEQATLWRNEPNPQRIGSGVVVDGRLYMANAGPNLFQCIDPASGEVLWQKRSNGGAHWGSMVHAGGLLYVTDQAGVTYVIRPSETELKIVEENPLGEGSNSTPAFANGRVLLRTFGAVYCVGSK